MLRILDITAPDINNGNGIRVTLWVAGCKHHCKGCHNQWTWDFNQGKPLTDDKFGREIYNQLENWLSRDYVEGLTISGGDPLCQDEDALYELNEIILWVHQEMQKNVWIYTGYVYEDLLKEIENIAIEKGCHLIHLDTFDFQAKDFYIKHGYEVFGVLDECPKKHKRYYLKKLIK